MKRKVITCDICGKDITNSEIRFKFKKYGKILFLSGEYKYKEKLDMCERCYKRLCRSVREEKKDNL